MADPTTPNPQEMIGSFSLLCPSFQAVLINFELNIMTITLLKCWKQDGGNTNLYKVCPLIPVRLTYHRQDT